MIPVEAYYKARKSGYTRKLEEIACKVPCWAYYFASNIPEVDFKYCQEKACKEPRWAYEFACDIPRADLNYCLEACKGTEWYAKMQALIMEEAIG